MIYNQCIKTREVNSMNKVYEFIMGLVFLGILFGLLAVGGWCDTHYSTTAEVLSTEESVLLVDGAGYVWEVTDRPDLHKGDFVKIKFYNNTTDYTREDDEILDVILLDR
jgi:hypothetical protein